MHTRCNHHFHHHCLARWLATPGAPTCPLCRGPIVSGSFGRYIYRARPLNDDLPILLAAGANAQLLDTLVFLLKSRQIHVRLLVIAITRSSNEPADPHTLVAQASQLWDGRILREPGEISPLGSDIHVRH